MGGETDKVEGRGDKIVALIPAHNESQRITQVIDRTQVHLPVLVVDDGSNDDTGACARQGGAVVVRQWPNQGKGAALKTGFRWAIKEGCDAVVTLDADGQHDPDEIPAFLEVYRRCGADLIIGERDFGDMPALRRLSNSLGCWTFSWALGRAVRDNQSGYRLIRRRLMEAMLASDEQGFEFEVDMIVTCVQRGLAMEGVSIRTIYADQTSHINNVRHVVNFLRMVWRTRKARRRGGSRG